MTAEQLVDAQADRVSAIDIIANLTGSNGTGLSACTRGAAIDDGGYDGRVLRLGAWNANGPGT